MTHLVAAVYSQSAAVDAALDIVLLFSPPPLPHAVVLFPRAVLRANTRAIMRGRRDHRQTEADQQTAAEVKASARTNERVRRGRQDRGRVRAGPCLKVA